ncbi:2'-5' RNA ligase family protein [Nocardia sp. BMG51109]|uniref:2'-5' RNA ligase family protein n=1 Tax=Nocardia sp. BMG51109 TaxID=1056816 RepID=UPI0018DD485E|nr:2'-5' RNA ligase family protein [Nocardia sp. BMG51109]
MRSANHIGLDLDASDLRGAVEEAQPNTVSARWCSRSTALFNLLGLRQAALEVLLRSPKPQRHFGNWQTSVVCPHSPQALMGLMKMDERTRDHWWWRPGWRPGRSFYTWHLTFADNSAAAGLVEQFAPTLADIPTMQPVAPNGLHITIQGIGFADAVSSNDLERIADTASEILQHSQRFEIVLGRPVADRETIGLPVVNPGPLTRVRSNLQSAIGAVWGDDCIPERTDRFTPHLTLAYSTGEAIIADLQRVLVRSGLGDAEITEPVTEISLIELNRDNHRYEWKNVGTMELGR